MKKLIGSFIVEEVVTVEIEVSDEVYEEFNEDDLKAIALLEEFGDLYFEKVDGFKHGSFGLRSEEKEVFE